MAVQNKDMGTAVEAASDNKTKNALLDLDHFSWNASKRQEKRCQAVALCWQSAGVAASCDV